MNVKTTVPITEARKSIFEIAQAVQTPGVHYTFTENGRPKAVLMSAEEFESWQETLEVMQQFPNLKKDMEKADRAVASGEYKNYPTLEEVMAEHGFVVADKAKTKDKYEMDNKIRSKSKKRA